MKVDPKNRDTWPRPQDWSIGMTEGRLRCCDGCGGITTAPRPELCYGCDREGLPKREIEALATEAEKEAGRK